MTAEQVIERPAAAIDPELRSSVIEEVQAIIGEIDTLLPGDPDDIKKAYHLLADCAALRDSLIAFADIGVNSRLEAMLAGRCVDLFLKGPCDPEIQAIAQAALAWMKPDIPPLVFLTEVAWGTFREASAGVSVPAKIGRLQYAKTFEHLKRIIGAQQPDLQDAALDAAAYKLAIELMQRDIAETVVS